MTLFLQVMGGLFLLLIVAFVAWAISFRLALKKFSREFDLSALNMGGTLPPIALHLEKIDKPLWGKAAEVAAAQDAILKLGFVPAGSFFVTNLPTTYVMGFADPVRGYWAAIVEHPMALMVDFVMVGEDGKVITVTDGKDADVRDTPENKVVSQPGASVEILYTLFQQLRPAGVRPADPDQFAAFFESEYRRGMERRHLEGCFDYDVIKSFSHLPNCGVDEETYQFLIQHKLIPDPNLLDNLTEKFKQTVSAKWWGKHQFCILFLYEGIDAEGLLDQLEYWEDVHSSDYEAFSDQLLKIEDLRGPELFWKAVTEAGFADQFEKHSTLTEPCYCEVLLYPGL